MDLKDRISSELWTKPSSSGNEMSGKVCMENSPFTQLSSQQGHQKWEDVSGFGKGVGVEPPLGKSNLSSECQSSIAANPGNGTNSLSSQDNQISDILRTSKSGDWDPRAMLNNLSVLEQKIHQLRNLVHTIVGRTSQVSGQQGELVAQQQQLVTADLTSIIVQLISTAGSLLPSVKHTLASDPSSIEQLGGVLLSSTPGTGGTKQSQPATGNKVSSVPNQMDQSGICSMEQNYSFEEHELKDDEDADDGETLSPGSYEILQLEKEEILAPHTHFCTICGKGFKRDANLRMHMRGHGDEYKTPAALAKPNKESTSEPVMIKRYSCPFAGCKRNREHKKFQPLKTILCVKNHYKRTHCDKRYTCSRCNTKKFSVIADLKTHEKHCGKDKWLCSCGTTFSRKDKLFGHIALFQGHTPAIPPDEIKGSGPGSSHENFDVNGATNKVGGIQFGFDCGSGNGNGIQGTMDMKVDADDSASCYSPLNFDTCNFGGFHEFPRPPFDDSESSFSFLLSGSCNYSHINGRESGSDGMQ